MCTSLIYKDKNDVPYLGRTLELDVDEPYVIVYVPKGQEFSSDVEGHDAVDYKVKHPFLAVSAPDHMPTADDPLKPNDLKVVEGLNLEGVTVSLLAYPTTAGEERTHEATRRMLQATDLGGWILSTCGTVEEVRSHLKRQPVFLTRIAVIGNTPFPFHLVVHDKSGDSIVIEWQHGKETVHDNPVGVMTNGPEFQWHMTNLRNWTHLDNVDHSANKFGDLEVNQPDSGIATASLPGSNTSVGRFIRAIYYTKFAEKVETDQAMLTLARVMDNFDRPRGGTVDPKTGGEGMTFEGKSRGDADAPSTEYTCWTNLSDLAGSKFMLRTYDAYGYSLFDLAKLAEGDQVKITLTTNLDAYGGDATDSMFDVPASS